MTYCKLKITLLVAFLLCTISGANLIYAQSIKLLVRADDLGASRSINTAIIKSYKEGIVRSAEVMVTGPWFEEAVKLANENPELDIGVHITLTSEWSNIKWRPLTKALNITDENGYFFPFVWKNDNYPMGSIMESNWDLEQIELEVRAQIELAIKRIPHISHLSTHMGCLSFSEEVSQLYHKLAKEYDLYILPQENNIVNNFPRWSGNKVGESKKIENLIENIETLKEGIYLLVEHPALDDHETQGMGHIGYDNVSEDRVGVLKAFTNKKVIDIIEEKNIELISYKDLINYYN